MKLKLKFYAVTVFLMILLCLTTIYAQDRPIDAVLFDAYEKPDCEMLISRIDHFIARLQEEPDAFGQLVFYGGPDPIENFNYARNLKDHFVERNVDKSRYSVITAKPDGALRMEAWITKKGAELKVEPQEYGYVLTGGDMAVLFGEDRFKVTDSDNKPDYFGYGCEICCLHYVHVAILSKFLEANPKMTAHFTIYNKTKKGSDELAGLILTKAVTVHKIPRARIKIKYGGVGAMKAIDDGKVSDVKVWLVPQK